jgi:hypothetical protein
MISVISDCDWETERGSSEAGGIVLVSIIAVVASFLVLFVPSAAVQRGSASASRLITALVAVEAVLPVSAIGLDFANDRD